MNELIGDDSVASSTRNANENSGSLDDLKNMFEKQVNSNDEAGEEALSDNADKDEADAFFDEEEKIVQEDDKAGVSYIDEPELTSEETVNSALNALKNASKMFEEENEAKEAKKDDDSVPQQMEMNFDDITADVSDKILEETIKEIAESEKKSSGDTATTVEDDPEYPENNDGFDINDDDDEVEELEDEPSDAFDSDASADSETEEDVLSTLVKEFKEKITEVIEDKEDNEANDDDKENSDIKADAENKDDEITESINNDTDAVDETVNDVPEAVAAMEAAAVMGKANTDESQKENNTEQETQEREEVNIMSEQPNFDEISDETAVITAGMTVNGSLETTGNLELQGTINGDIRVNGKVSVSGKIDGNTVANEVFSDGAQINGDVDAALSVKVGQDSVIIGNVTATSAVIAGAVKGNIDVKGPVILDSSAIVMGNIKSMSVQINNGAVVDGMCSQCYAEMSPASFFDDFKKKKN